MVNMYQISHWYIDRNNFHGFYAPTKFLLRIRIIFENISSKIEYKTIDNIMFELRQEQ